MPNRSPSDGAVVRVEQQELPDATGAGNFRPTSASVTIAAVEPALQEPGVGCVDDAIAGRAHALPAAGSPRSR